MALIADWMLKGIQARHDTEVLKKLNEEVEEFSRKFPLPSDES